MRAGRLTGLTLALLAGIGLGSSNGVRAQAAAPADTRPAGCSPGQAPSTDLAALFDHIGQHMAYAPLPGVDLQRARALFLAEAARLPPQATGFALLEAAAREPGDHHIGLNANRAASPPLVPSGTQLWGRWDQAHGGIRLDAVRPASPARAAGLREGMVVQTVNGQPVRPLAESLMPRTMPRGSQAGLDYGSQIALAGARTGPTELQAGWPGQPPRGYRFVAMPGADHVLAVQRLPDGVAVIRFHNSLGDSRTVEAFARAMQELVSQPSLDPVRGPVSDPVSGPVRGIVLDLRDTPSGGNTGVAEPILDWFTTRPATYQLVQARAADAPAVLRRIQGRPDAWTGPVVVLVDRWTGSMGEGLAIGLRAVTRATLVGTPMAGLRGAMEAFPLPCSGVAIRLPVARLLAVDGTPREAVRPDVQLTPRQLAPAGAEDAILAAGLAAMRARAASTPQQVLAPPAASR